MISREVSSVEVTRNNYQEGSRSDRLMALFNFRPVKLDLGYPEQVISNLRRMENWVAIKYITLVSLAVPATVEGLIRTSFGIRSGDWGSIIPGAIELTTGITALTLSASKGAERFKQLVNFRLKINTSPKSLVQRVGSDDLDSLSF